MRAAFVAIALAVSPLVAAAATLVVDVRDAQGAAIGNAVVYAIPDGRKVAPPTKPAILDQKDRMFVPHILAVQTGTSVSFPNSDNVRHQVYSFSPAKRFQLPLYEGTPAEPVVFDKPGVVALGCNIHDRMSAYVVVVDTPYFSFAPSGRAELPNLPDGSYSVRAWYEGLRSDPPAQAVSVSGGERVNVAIQVLKR